MTIYNVPVTIYATAYVRASSEDEALAMAQKALAGTDLIFGEADERVSGKEFSDPTLPAVSISPAMGIGDLDGYVEEIA